jgi:hypothetical protein
MALPMEQDEPGLQGCNAFRRYRMNRDYRDVMLWEVEDESSYPVHIGLLGADAIMLQAQTLADPVQESGLGGHRRET